MMHLIARLLVLVTLQSAVSNGEEVCTTDDGSAECMINTDMKETASCSLYMAPSTIPGAGLGIFTGIDRRVGEIVGQGDVILPISDLEFHFQANENYDPYFYYDPTKEYVWAGGQMGVQFESAAEESGVSAFVPGLDCVVNCHLGLLNVDNGYPTFDNAGLHRSRDPGTGAFTPYYNSTTFVKYEIPAGGELFKDYGDAWFEDRVRLLGLIPLRDDYMNAEQFTKDFKALAQSTKLPFQVQEELWTMINGLPFHSRLFNAMPSKFDQVDKVISEGIRSIYQPHSTRSVTELDRIGRCLDKIQPGARSTIPQAGRGAFATRLIRKGEVVIGTPLIFTPTDDFYRMYQGDWIMQSAPPDRNNLKRMQLIINYSWKHPESSLFLIPYGPLAQLINHNQTQANVRVQWAKHGEMSQNHAWLTKSPEAIFPSATPGLFWDFIAMREIQPGEEIFLDYGDDWEKAWTEHVKNWKPPIDAEDYISARQWVQENPDAMLRTEEEQGIDPYPDNFEMRCIADIIELYTAEENLTNDQAKDLWHEKAQSMICTVQERRQEPNGEYVYKVHYLPLGLFDTEDVIGEDGLVNWYESTWIPRGAISFAEKPYSTDIFLEGAFRHPIQIPDDIFPKPWQGFEGTLYW